jgi:hypothetical protein
MVWSGLDWIVLRVWITLNITVSVRFWSGSFLRWHGSSEMSNRPLELMTLRGEDGERSLHFSNPRRGEDLVQRCAAQRMESRGATRRSGGMYGSTVQTHSLDAIGGRSMVALNSFDWKY